MASNIHIQKERQSSRVQDEESLQLDILLEATLRYLDILRFESLRQIELDNLSLTQKNLELAKAREQAGTGTRAEIFRWESEIANSRQSVLLAEARYETGKLSLARLLHLDQSDLLILEPVDLNHPTLKPMNKRVLQYLGNKRYLNVFADFQVEQGWVNSPDLKGLQHDLRAATYRRTAAKRKYWIPDVNFFAAAGKDLARNGSGSALPGTLDRDDWSVGVDLSIPLYAGGSRASEVRQSSDSVRRLQLTVMSTQERVEESIRSSLIDAVASYNRIYLSQSGADAARESYEYVLESYSRGVVQLVDLVDAQTASLVAGLQAVNAVYDFLSDLMRLNRSVSSFEYFKSKHDRDAWLMI